MREPQLWNSVPLRAGHQWPGCCHTAGERNEFPPLHMYPLATGKLSAALAIPLEPLE